MIINTLIRHQNYHQNPSKSRNNPSNQNLEKSIKSKSRKVNQIKI